jgi:hypothetical protein
MTKTEEEFKDEIRNGRYSSLLNAERAIGRWPNPSAEEKGRVLEFARSVLEDKRQPKAHKPPKKPVPQTVEDTILLRIHEKRMGQRRSEYMKALVQLQMNSKTAVTRLLQSAIDQRLDLLAVKRDWKALGNALKARRSPRRPDPPGR